MKWCRTQKTLRSAWKKLENLESFKRLLPACTTCFEFLRVQAKSQTRLWLRKSVKFVQVFFVLCFLMQFLFNEILWGLMFIACLEALEIWGCVQACSLTFHTQTANAKCFGDRLLEQDTATPHAAKSEWLGGSWAFKHSSFTPFDFRWSYYIFNIYFIRSTSFLDSSPQLQVLHLPDFASLSNVVIFLLELLNALLCAFFFHRWWESLPVALPEAARNNRTWHQPPSMAPLPLPCTQPPRERGWALQIYESQCLFFAEESFWTLLKHVEAVQSISTG